MDDRQRWIDRYNRGDGSTAGGGDRVQWPDLLIEPVNLECLIEGVLAERVDWPALVFDNDPPPDDVLEAIEIYIRVPDLQVRFAPEGLHLRSRAEILLRMGGPGEETDSFAETLEVKSEICLSFTERFGINPVVDLLSGKVCLVSTGATVELAPATEIIDPERAVEWGLNGCQGTDGSG